MSITLELAQCLALVVLTLLGVLVSDWLSGVILHKHPWSVHKRDCEEFCKIRFILDRWYGNGYKLEDVESLDEVVSYVTRAGYATFDNRSTEEIATTLKNFHNSYSLCYPTTENVPSFLDNRTKNFETFMAMYLDYRMGRMFAFAAFLSGWVIMIIVLMLLLLQYRGG